MGFFVCFLGARAAASGSALILHHSDILNLRTGYKAQRQARMFAAGTLPGFSIVNTSEQAAN